MCEPSKVTDDWVIKGCHIHVNGIELNVYTDHLARIDFRPVFSSTSPDDLRAAVKAAYEDCLADGAVRQRWMTRLDMARIFMLNYRGRLYPKANGRMLEFKFLRIAIARWELHGNP
jgi:hypothetical protein